MFFFFKWAQRTFVLSKDHPSKWNLLYLSKLFRFTVKWNKKKNYNRKQPSHTHTVAMRTRLPTEKKNFVGIHTTAICVFLSVWKEKEEEKKKKMTRQTFGSQIRLILTIPPVYERVVSSLIIARTDLFFRAHTQMTTIFKRIKLRLFVVFFSGPKEAYVYVRAWSERVRI